MIKVDRQRRIIKPACIEKWQRLYNFEDREWSSIFTFAFKTCQSTKLQSFQYRLIHRVITCNYWLFKAKIKDSPSCKYCSSDDTIEHFFLHCNDVALFWRMLTSWWNRVVNDDSQINVLDDKDILFGIKTSNTYICLLNSIILCAKKYIHDIKLSSDQHISFITFLIILKQHATYQNEISNRNINRNQARDIWYWLYDQL